MFEVILLNWLSDVHLRKETLGLDIPDVPSLGRFIQFSNKFSWDESCYQEVESVESASSIHFVE